jgi:cytochrome P450
MDTPFDPATFDPHATAFLANPYPTYAWFREHAPIHPVRFAYGEQTLYDSTWLFRYADVQTVLQGKALFLKNRKPPVPLPPPFDVLQNMPNGVFNLDPPRHDVLRPILDTLLAEAIAGISAIAAATATQLLEAAKASRRIELVAAYAMPLPSIALRTVLGISPGDWAGIERWVSAVVAGHDYTASAAAQGMGGTCAMALGAYFQALTRGCPMRAESGKMIDLMVSKAEPKGISREEVQQTAVTLAVAGYVSTVFLIATGTLSLLKNASQLALLRGRPELINNAVEEMLRYEAPVQLADRYVAEDTQIAGVTFKAGQQVTAVLGSANRDPDAFANPDAFDITRECKAHVGFGDGIHTCLGAPLVRQVAPVAFQALLNALPELALDGIPQWQTDPYLRSVANLPLAIG